MRRTSVLIAFAVLMLATPAAATPITYTFSGEGGLAGTFILDDEVPFVLSEIPGYRGGFLSSPLFSLSGTFGSYEFSGTPALSVLDDLQLFDFNNLDHWIVRAPITVSSGGVPAIAQLNLFIYGGVNGISLIPPVPSSPNQFNFQYTVQFSDESFVGGPLHSLTVHVSEPSVPFVLPLLGFAAVAAAKFLTRFERVEHIPN